MENLKKISQILFKQKEKNMRLFGKMARFFRIFCIRSPLITDPSNRSSFAGDIFLKGPLSSSSSPQEKPLVLFSSRVTLKTDSTPAKNQP